MPPAAGGFPQTTMTEEIETQERRGLLYILDGHAGWVEPKQQDHLKWCQDKILEEREIHWIPLKAFIKTKPKLETLHRNLSPQQNRAESSISSTGAHHGNLRPKLPS
jgi:hypothetical protein